MGNKPSRRKYIIAYSISTIMLLFITFEIVALALWVPGTWNQKGTAVFAVIGMYGFATAFFSSEALFAYVTKKRSGERESLPVRALRSGL
jgi:NADH:ubiquinone oxidoreductase subunit 3 (subunit A)